MTTTEDLRGSDAAHKIRDLADGKICHFVTFNADGVSTRPMGPQAVDDDGRLWFFSPRHSTKNKELAADARVQLLFADAGASAYLAVRGTGVVVEDREKIKQLYSPLANTWFDGPDDPELSLIEVVPRGGHYWDTEHNKVVQMVGFVVGAITGKTTDDGREGELQPAE